ncbi:hypothetical protein AOQ73_02860 [Bradyrhizobium pachyrhizi]|nr:hypothetical protein AOQ73_02860 [Bradyrhizobium pachyrhizi]OMI14783.1 hypothetical protein BSN85_02855 [Bradyrhizobium brasilense]
MLLSSPVSSLCHCAHAPKHDQESCSKEALKRDDAQAELIALARAGMAYSRFDDLSNGYG